MAWSTSLRATTRTTASGVARSLAGWCLAERVGGPAPPAPAIRRDDSLTIRRAGPPRLSTGGGALAFQPNVVLVSAAIRVPTGSLGCCCSSFMGYHAFMGYRSLMIERLPREGLALQEHSPPSHPCEVSHVEAAAGNP